MKASVPTILAFDSADVSLASAGGKARSLAKLATAGLPVPDGFLISTAAYEEFLEQNQLTAPVEEMLDGLKQQLAAIEPAARRIRDLFECSRVPGQIADSISQAYSELGDEALPVAVRSSATAEDLADLSFAGQQDSYLNVVGRKALLDAVRRCWGSLWTSRAVLYRMRMNVDQRSVAMGVIVQRMVDADASGILFTVNPSSGERSELIVNASYGLGEAIVGGRASPDSYRMDRDSLAINESTIGGKELMIVCSDAGGTIERDVVEADRGRLSLQSDELVELAKLSLRVERLFGGVPQDIEWAVAAGKCWLLQSRPITNLPPAPLKDVRWDPPAKGVKLIRRQVVENMPQPLSPLFAELYLGVGLEAAIDTMMEQWKIGIEIDELVERPFFVTVNGYSYCRASYRSLWRIVWKAPRLIYWYVTTIPRLLRNVIAMWRDEGLPRYLEKVAHWKSVDRSSAPDRRLLEGVRELAVADAHYWFDATIVLAAAKITDGLLNRYLNCWLVRSPYNSGNFLRGFPSKLLDAQLDLEAIAGRARQDQRLADLLTSIPAADLLQQLADEEVGQTLHAELEQHLQQYGHQIYTLDFVEPTQVDDPLPVMLSLQELVRNPVRDSGTRQAELARMRETQIDEAMASLGPLRRRLLRLLLRWAQAYGPYREESLFYLGSAWPTLRRLALELGQRLVDGGMLQAADDVFYLTSSELSDACELREQARADSEFARRSAQRRELRELRKRLHPPGMVPEHSKFKIGPFDFSALETQKRNTSDSATLQGFAVSPGKVSGEASLILSPADFDRMKPNTILVCPTTTPAWTPLLAQASGLATDIGGILAHGSIVAREYGIPAVMGTGNVTQRVAHGQQIVVDGDAGTVVIEHG